jgi:NADH-quinone oxidoreductase subunit D
MEYCERASGARMHTSYFRFGGVYSILDDEILKDIGDFSNNFLLRLHETSVLLSNSRI